jgi:cobalamin biosynthesis Mg chelatase CobN
MEEKTKRKCTKKAEKIEAEADNSADQAEEMQQQANPSENARTNNTNEPLTDNDIRILEGTIDREEEVASAENTPIVINKGMDNSLSNTEIAFIRRLFKRYNESSFWSIFWSVVALLLVVIMCYLVYLFLRSAGTIPFTHLRFR